MYTGLVDPTFPYTVQAMACATDTFLLMYVVSLLPLSLKTLAEMSCSLGMFCPIGADCTNNTNLCITACPTLSDCMQQGSLKFDLSLASVIVIIILVHVVPIYVRKCKKSIKHSASIIGHKPHNIKPRVHNSLLWTLDYTYNYTIFSLKHCTALCKRLITVSGIAKPRLARDYIRICIC